MSKTIKNIPHYLHISHEHILIVNWHGELFNEEKFNFIKNVIQMRT